MWEYGGFLESVQQYVFTKGGLLESHVIGTCELWARTQGTGIISMNAREGLQPNRVTLGGVLNACASIVALKEGRLGV
jgi:hypothetical protein